MKAYIEMMRPNNGVLAVLGIIIGAIVAGTFAASYAILFAVVVSFLINGAGNVINDYFDHKIDKVNRPKRPIPSGRVKRDSALMYFIALTLVGLMLSYFISRDFLLIAVINTIVSFVYSWKLKGAPFIGRPALEQVKAKGVTRKLVGFRALEKGVIPRHGYDVYLGERKVDVVRSGGFSPTLKQAIGTTYLPTHSVEPGTKFLIDCRGKKVQAEVVKMPFHKGSVKRK